MLTLPAVLPTPNETPLPLMMPVIQISALLSALLSVSVQPTFVALGHSMTRSVSFRGDIVDGR
ncbi:Uncharacterised protein [Citrobacter koseri]|uniref:Uncharacterized protein n=1 Tax=Citrobacter koseri TaxID=545 RepID=A0A2X2VRA2_CITKO|nr:Uncharacterised protein [Citrobacter koseri]